MTRLELPYEVGILRKDFCVLKGFCPGVWGALHLSISGLFTIGGGVVFMGDTRLVLGGWHWGFGRECVSGWLAGRCAVGYGQRAWGRPSQVGLTNCGGDSCGGSLFGCEEGARVTGGRTTGAMRAGAMGAKFISGMRTLRTGVGRVHRTRGVFTAFARRRISGVFCRTTVTTGGRHVPLTELTMRRARENVLRSGIVGGRCTTRCVCGTCGSAGAYNIMRRSGTFKVGGVTRPVKLITTIVPAAGPASATVFGALVYLGAEGTVVVDPRPTTGTSAVTTTGIILSTTIGTKTPRKVVK